MNGYPLHVPSQLDRNQSGAREDLYRRGEVGRSRYHGWEGIDAAQERQSKPTKTPEQIIDATLNRLYERLSVARGATVHINPETGKQVTVDPKTTAKLINNLLDVANSTRSPEVIDRITKEVEFLREGFKSAKNANN